MLQGRSKVIKTLLLDQSFIAGIGNIYADESFQGPNSPLEGLETITLEEAKRLHSAIVSSLGPPLSIGDFLRRWERELCLKWEAGRECQRAKDLS